MPLAVKLFHIGVLGLYIYVVHSLVTSGGKSALSDDPNIKAVGKFTFRFLTNWTYGAQLIYFTTCVLGHFLNIIPKLHRVRDKVNSFGNSLFTTIAGPMAFVVTISFWAIYAIDRELVYPKWIDRVIPMWINHAIHTLNSIFPLLDLCLVNHKFPSYLFALKSISAYMLAYGICLYGTYFQTGLWLYPFLQELSWLQRAMLNIFTLGLALSLFAILLLISRALWGSTKEAPVKQTKSKKSARQKSKKSA